MSVHHCAYTNLPWHAHIYEIMKSHDWSLKIYLDNPWLWYCVEANHNHKPTHLKVSCPVLPTCPQKWLSNLIQYHCDLTVEMFLAFYSHSFQRKDLSWVLSIDPSKHHRRSEEIRSKAGSGWWVHPCLTMHCLVSCEMIWNQLPNGWNKIRMHPAPKPLLICLEEYVTRKMDLSKQQQQMSGPLLKTWDLQCIAHNSHHGWWNPEIPLHTFTILYLFHAFSRVSGTCHTKNL